LERETDKSNESPGRQQISKSFEERKPKTKGLGDVLKKLTEDKDTADKAEKMLEKAPKESKKIARKPAAEKEAKAAKAEAPKKAAEEKAEAPKKTTKAKKAE